MSVSKYKVKGGYRWRYNISRRDSVTGENRDISRRGFKKKSEALNAQELMKNELETNERSGMNQVNDTMTMNDLFNVFINKRKRTAEITTIQTYETNYNKWFKSKIGGKKIIDLNEDNLEALFDWMTPQLSLTSLNSQKVLLSMIFKEGIRRNIILFNPAINITIKKKLAKKSTNNKKKTMDKQEVIILFKTLVKFLKTQTNTIYSRDYTFYYLSALTGVRISELITLRWEDIDFENETVNINKAQKSAYGKVYEGKTKTVSTNRTIIIKVDKFWDYLKKWKIEQEELKEKIGNTPNGEVDTLIFHDLNKSKRLARTFYRNLLNKLFEENPKLTQITPHSFRHTIISFLRRNNCLKEKVEFYLGQKTGTAVVDGYTDWGQETMEEMAEEIAKIYKELI